jgi:sporulation protein YlmC with PRC-barrel domain
MDMPLNVEVYCVDGLCGQSKELVLDRQSEEVTHLVVIEKHWPYTEIMVPVDLVAETTPHLIRLRCGRDRLAQLPSFASAEFVRVSNPPHDPHPYLMPADIPEASGMMVRHESISSERIAVRQRARVEATDGHVGRIDEFIMDPVSKHATHIVIREGHLWGERDVAVPFSEIDHLEEATIYLKLDRGQVEALPSLPDGML